MPDSWGPEMERNIEFRILRSIYKEYRPGTIQVKDCSRYNGFWVYPEITCKDGSIVTTIGDNDYYLLENEYMVVRP